MSFGSEARHCAAPARLSRTAWCLSAAAIAPLTPAMAQVETSGAVSLVSQYRYRGERQAPGPDLQAEFEAAFASGWSVDFWGSTLGRPSLKRLELDLSAGRTVRRGATSIGLFADVVGYTEGQGSYVQARAQATQSLGKGIVELELSSAPQGGRTASFLYSGVTASHPITPALTATGHAGLDVGAHGRADWALAGAWQRGPMLLTLSATATSSRQRGRRPALVLSLARNF
ncbi:TorF family putative porin [Sphingomonas jatrophae]|uniref:TorF family putative porin n=1 Tax=Sphingomonas jatrophae TaxID=1166337 RepID=UPI0013F4EBF9|nr:TorF family putative porin [Sphingomonas jatrophae]